MKNINRIIKEKVVLKYILNDIDELKEVNYRELIPMKDIVEKSVEITYKHKDKLLIIDYIKRLSSTRTESEQVNKK